jgi:hypothetical protein
MNVGRQRIPEQILFSPPKTKAMIWNRFRERRSHETMGGGGGGSIWVPCRRPSPHASFFLFSSSCFRCCAAREGDVVLEALTTPTTSHPLAILMMWIHPTTPNPLSISFHQQQPPFLSRAHRDPTPPCPTPRRGAPPSRGARTQAQRSFSSLRQTRMQMTRSRKIPVRSANTNNTRHGPTPSALHTARVHHRQNRTGFSGTNFFALCNKAANRCLPSRYLLHRAFAW